MIIVSISIVIVSRSNIQCTDPMPLNKHEYMDELQYYYRPNMITCQRNRWIGDDENGNCRG